MLRSGFRRLAVTGAVVALAQSGAVFADDTFLDQASITWKVNQHAISRWKTLIGGDEGGQINDEDIQFGLWELAPRATYHGHKHDAPEIYFITAGKARWTVGEESREVTRGMTIYTRPGRVHKMVNLTDESVRAIWVWWAPGGDRDVFSGDYTFTEPAPAQPEAARFDDPEAEKLY